MAEINNSLALGVKPAEFDIAKTLLPAAQINYLRANTAQNEQETQYRQFQQDSNEGYRVPEVNTLAEAHTKQLGVAGQVGNMMVNAKSLADRQQAIKAAEDSGVKIDPQVKQHLLNAPDAQFKQYGQNLQRAGQTATANIEQNPGALGQRSYMGSAGSTAGQVGGDLPPVPTVPAMTQAQADNAVATRTNADGSPRVLSLNGNVPEQPGAPAVNPLAAKGATEASNEQLKKNVEIGADQYKGYQKSQEASGVTKIVLKSLVDDSDRVFTGNGAETALNARKWVQSAQQLPGVGDFVKKFTANVDDPVAAAENIRKNIGIIAREAMGSLGGSAAAELDNITSSLPNQKMSGQGLKLAASQMIAIEDYKQARLRAADQWKGSHGGSMDGFATDMAKNMGPGVFVMARLPKEEQVALTQRLQKTPEGKRTLASIHRQSLWVEQHHLEDVID